MGALDGVRAVDFSSIGSNISEIYVALHGYQRTREFRLHVTSDSSVSYQDTIEGKVSYVGGQLFKYLQLDFSPPPTLDAVLTNILHDQFNANVIKVVKYQSLFMAHQVRAIETGMNITPTEGQRNNQKTLYRDDLTHQLQGTRFNTFPAFTADNDFFPQVLKRPLSESELDSIRSSMMDFHNAAELFWRFFALEGYDYFTAPLNHLIGNVNLYLTDRSLYHYLLNAHQRIHLEGILKQPFPYLPLTKVMYNIELSQPERKALRDWIDQVNQKEDQIEVEKFVSLIKEAAKAIELATRIDLCFDRLLLALDKCHCTILYKDDQTYLKMRDRLRFGSTITCNGKGLIIGRQLSPEKTRDIYKVFTLVDAAGLENGSQVVKFANNAFRLILDSYKFADAKEHWGFLTPAMIGDLGGNCRGLDKEGLCIVQERLKDPLHQYTWTSRKTPLDPRDERKAMVIANHIYFQQQSDDFGATTYGLSLSHLMFNSQGVLKSLRILKKGEADYNQWEDFFFQVAKGNKHVLSYLMKVSKLFNHPIGQFYKGAVEHTLRTGETDILSRQHPDGWLDKYNERVTQLCERAKLVRKDTVDEAIVQNRTKYKESELGPLREEVYDMLVSAYEVSFTPGRLDYTEIKNTALTGINLPADEDLEGVDFGIHNHYYTAQHRLMTGKNNAVLVTEQRIRDAEARRITE